MDFKSLSELAPTCGDFISILPEFSLSVSAVFCLIIASLIGHRFYRQVNILSVFTTLASLLIALYFSSAQQDISFNGAISVYGAFTYYTYMCLLITQVLAVRYLYKNPSNHKAEYIPVFMFASAAIMLLSRAENLILLFIALECVSIAFYALVSWTRKSVICMDGSIKYMIISGVSSAILLLGIVLIYGASLHLKLDSALLYIDNFKNGYSSMLFCAGLVFVFSGLLFKLAAFPFQFWVSDVYQASPTPTSAFLAVVSKAVAIYLIVKICLVACFPTENVLNAASLIAILTILAGNLPAILQLNTKRLMALSGVSNAGYLLLLACVAIKLPENSLQVLSILFFYLIAYAFATFALFAIINQSKDADDSAQTIDDYKGLFKKDKITSTALVASLASLAGIPPTAGFFGKVLIIILAWQASLYLPLSIMIFGSVISIYYYFAWMRAPFAQDYDNVSNFGKSRLTSFLLMILTGCTLIFGFTSIYIFSA